MIATVDDVLVEDDDGDDEVVDEYVVDDGDVYVWW